MSTINGEVKHRRGISKKTIARNRKSVSKRVGGFRLPERSKLSAWNFLKRLGKKMAKALRLWRRASPEVSSSGRSRPLIATTDNHKSAAIEDCIEFINSSASLPRSN